MASGALLVGHISADRAQVIPRMTWMGTIRIKESDVKFTWIISLFYSLG